MTGNNTVYHFLGAKDDKSDKNAKAWVLKKNTLIGLIQNFKVGIICVISACPELGETSPQVRGISLHTHSVFLLSAENLNIEAF